MMNTQAKLAVLTVVAAGSLFTGTAQARDPVVAAVLGAGAGALIGSAIGGEQGAVIGGVIGAATGVVAARSHVVVGVSPAYPVVVQAGYQPAGYYEQGGYGAYDGDRGYRQGGYYDQRGYDQLGYDPRGCDPRNYGQRSYNQGGYYGRPQLVVPAPVFAPQPAVVYPPRVVYAPPLVVMPPQVVYREYARGYHHPHPHGYYGNPDGYPRGYRY